MGGLLYLEQANYNTKLYLQLSEELNKYREIKYNYTISVNRAQSQKIWDLTNLYSLGRHSLTFKEIPFHKNIHSTILQRVFLV